MNPETIIVILICIFVSQALIIYCIDNWQFIKQKGEYYVSRFIDFIQRMDN